MSLRDRRRWRAPQSAAGLGEPMALWLEGTIRSWPGYAPRYGPDEETAHLVPTLAALNRAGFVTVASQPGQAGPGVDGQWWEQRAAVEGYVSDGSLYERLMDVAGEAGLITVTNDPVLGCYEDPEVVTTCAGEPITWFGHHLSYRDMRVQWPHISLAAFSDLHDAVSLAIIAPEYGAGGERLWHVLGSLTAGNDGAYGGNTALPSRQAPVSHVAALLAPKPTRAVPPRASRSTEPRPLASYQLAGREPCWQCGQPPVEGTHAWDDRGDFQLLSNHTFKCANGHAWRHSTDGG
ncbi:DUF6919 domain-containing protein [Streptomyces sp. NPDC058595]|uniref:DUF6919 domain-containing protein n=1 Tax=Streptomyces sp. NPDC058595 TaxID=3346550 RepID=UPI0036649CBF